MPDSLAAFMNIIYRRLRAEGEDLQKQQIVAEASSETFSCTFTTSVHQLLRGPMTRINLLLTGLCQNALKSFPLPGLRLSGKLARCIYITLHRLQRFDVGHHSLNIRENIHSIHVILQATYVFKSWVLRGLLIFCNFAPNINDNICKTSATSRLSPM